MTVTVTVTEAEKCKDCRRGRGVERCRRYGEREMEDEGEGRRVEGEIEGRDERWEGGRGEESSDFLRSLCVM